jgi:hypothetical protein
MFKQGMLFAEQIDLDGDGWTLGKVILARTWFPPREDCFARKKLGRAQD